MYRNSFQNHYRRNRNSPRFHRSARQKRPNIQYNTQPVTQIAAEHVQITHQFSDFALNSKLKENIAQKGFKVPTPIQDQAILPLLEGKDVIGIAETGSGKTAAFLIPLINKVVSDPAQKVLIIVPTRELAVQIDSDFKSLSRSLNIYSALCIGGLSMRMQVFELRKNPKFLICTPGRLKDMVNRRFLNLNNFTNIVLDEADRMVDIGFLPEIKYLVSLLPKQRQSLFFSATVTPEVNSIIKSFVSDPVTVMVKSNEIPVSIKEDVIRVNNPEEKIIKLKTMLKNEEFKKVLIFGRTKHGVERLSRKLFQDGFSVASIHGNKTQNQRLRVLMQFKNNQLQILVATDIAARGLDIPNVSHVINYDEPENKTDYIHRIGRTGRAQQKGFALTFVGR